MKAYWLWPFRIIEWLKLLVFALIFFSLSKIVFVVWNLNEWPALNTAEWLRLILLSLRGDLATATLLLSPWILLSLIPLPQNMVLPLRKVIILFIKLFFLIALSLNMFDIEWHKFTASRINFSQIYLLKELSTRDFSAVVIYWPLFLVSFILAWAWWKFFPLPQNTQNLPSYLPAINKCFSLWPLLFKKNSQVSRWRAFLFYFIFFAARTFLILAIFVTFARGGWQKRPLEPVVFSTFPHSLVNILSYNSVLSLMHTWNEKLFVAPQWPTFNDEHRRQLKAYQDLKRSIPPAIQLPKDTNLVLLVVESLAYAFLEQGGGHPEWTPFVNSLPHQGAALLPGLASGRRTVEGLLALLASLPAWSNEPLIFTSASQIPIPSLKHSFPQHELLFFHGSYEGSLNLNHLAFKLGFNKYIGFKDFPDSTQDDGAWGIWDHAFLPWVSAQLSLQTRPFLATILTLSSHYPFQLPKNYSSRIAQDPKYPIIATIAYADDALRLFFEHARQQNWFKKTLFVILGDHSVSSIPVKVQRHERSFFEIPIIFYHPQINFNQLFAEKNLHRQLFTQLDILSTLKRWTNQAPELSENNLFSTPLEVPDEQRISIHKSHECLQMLTDTKLLRSCDGQTMNLQSILSNNPTNEANEKLKEYWFQALVAFFIQALQVRSWSLNVQ